MKIVAFAASSSLQSINKKLVSYAASQLKGVETELLDLNDYELPLFSEDKQKELGSPQLALDFLAKIAGADGLLISFAEHNGTYTAAYKNLFDWCSLIKKPYQNKPMIMLSTSPGERGGASVLQQAVASAPHFKGDVKASLAIPSFHEHFDIEKACLSDEVLNKQLLAILGQWQRV